MISLLGIRGAAILVVEDNQINQLVAREILEKEGFWVDIAENGAIAVEAIGKKQYDLVLMDLQMPVMDGYSATELIRQQGFHDLPIVALSADVSEGTIEGVEKAGMNYFLTKPINREELFTTFVKWIPPGNRLVKEVLNHKEEEMLNQFREKLKSFDIDSGLARVIGNQKLYFDILQKFKVNYQNVPDEIEHLVREEDSYGLKQLLHSIKGVTGNIGLIEIYETLQRLEKKVQSDIHFVTREEILVIQHKMEAAILEIEQLTRRNSGDEQLFSLTELLEHLEELRRLLDDYDTRAEYKMKEVKTTLIHFGQSSEANKMETAMGNYDMELAYLVCNMIIETLKTGV